MPIRGAIDELKLDALRQRNPSSETLDDLLMTNFLLTGSPFLAFPPLFCLANISEGLIAEG